MRKIKNLLRFLIGARNETEYYSQGGEDAIVSKTFSFLLPTVTGFYLDIGAYHPYKHSNTYILYKAGWRGMNVDPRPGTKALFDRYRKGDINIEAGVGASDAKMTYYIIDKDSTMNSFSKDNLQRLGVFDDVKETVEVPIRTLGSLLAEHPSIECIDYMNVDAEGFEIEILSGLDSISSKPKVISVEQNGVLTLSDVSESSTAVFLREKGYVPYAKNLILKDVSTVFYIRNEIMANTE